MRRTGGTERERREEGKGCVVEEVMEEDWEGREVMVAGGAGR